MPLCATVIKLMNVSSPEVHSITLQHVKLIRACDAYRATIVLGALEYFSQEES